jgi:hypothetical protein
MAANEHFLGREEVYLRQLPHADAANQPIPGHRTSIAAQFLRQRFFRTT